mmetsp:Transcript_91196/g.161512  ORF Transcript_91196/g.161512 Transcript_91196/m.161512 type:complete len:98 (+) Transcript_91196:487-780(+)
MKAAVYRVPTVPMREPIAKEERLRMSERGSNTKADRPIIHVLDWQNIAGRPVNDATDAKASPRMMEKDSPPMEVLNATASAGMMAVLSPNSLAQISR